VRLQLAQREVALAGVALLATAIALAVSSAIHAHGSRLPLPIGSYTALAGSSGFGTVGTKTACGDLVSATIEGVANPVLPCGVQIYVGYGGKHVLTRVIDRGPYVPGRQFDLTDALAHRLGLFGVQRIEWSYAQAG
jgi:rare lipoprotein A